jgi:preprotein translocase subunit SecE
MARQQNPRSMVGPTSGGRGAGLGFFREVYAELRRIVWPSREEATRLTQLVIAVAVVVAIFLAIVDSLFTRVFNVILFP